jgi:hypothetical protein
MGFSPSILGWICTLYGWVKGAGVMGADEGKGREKGGWEN